jgi:hypothetical protein
MITAVLEAENGLDKNWDTTICNVFQLLQPMQRFPQTLTCGEARDR